MIGDLHPADDDDVCWPKDKRCACWLVALMSPPLIPETPALPDTNCDRPVVIKLHAVMIFTQGKLSKRNPEVGPVSSGRNG